MKNKWYSLLLSFLVLASPVFAKPVTFKERTDNWLKSTAAEDDGDIGPGTKPGQDDPRVGPIGGGELFLLTSGMIYGLYLFGKKHKRKELF
jgi:hypothetical protein